VPDCENVDELIEARWWGEERPDRAALGEDEDAALRRSSVALRRASRASSSVVWEDTFCFLIPQLILRDTEGFYRSTFRRQQHRDLQGSCRF